MTKLIKNNSYIGLDNYYVICDSCGKKIRAKDALLRWDNFLVCEKDYEEQHPQDMNITPRGQQKLNPKYVRPEAEDTFGTGSAEDL